MTKNELKSGFLRNRPHQGGYFFWAFATPTGDRGGGNFKIAESVFKKYIACLWKIAHVTSRKVVYTLIVFNRILGFILCGFDPWEGSKRPATMTIYDKCLNCLVFVVLFFQTVFYFVFEFPINEVTEMPNHWQQFSRFDIQKCKGNQWNVNSA